jgi:hypothetical protein
MCLARSLHKLIDLLNNKRDVRVSNGQIIQTAYQLSIH